MYIQVSWFLLTILTDLNSCVIWDIWVLPFISCFRGLFSKLLRNIANTLTVMCIIVSFMFSMKYFTMFPLSFILTLSNVGKVKPSRWKLTERLFVWPGLVEQFVSKNPWEFYVSHVLRRILVCTPAIWLFAQILIFSPIPPVLIFSLFRS